MKKNSMRLLGFLLVAMMMVSLFAVGVFAEDTATPVATADGSVAKVGSTEYATIDEAIANWTAGTTLTLLDNVTLSDVITLKSTEHHKLDLGTYTMTAASGKHAIEITCQGLSGATYALTVNADAENPGGITATGKSCIYYRKSGTTKDRPIIQINGGVFNGSYAINVYSSNRGTNCPQVNIAGGIFNGNVNIGHGKLMASGGIFNGWVNCTGDSTAYRQISGGTYKNWQFMTADASNKFWVGTSLANYNVGCYVDDDGYLVVGGSIITDAGTQYEASTPYSTWSNYLVYSSANENGLYWVSVEDALAKKTSGTVTVYIDELDLTGTTFKGTILLPEADSELTVTFAEGTEPAWVVATEIEGKKVVFTDSVANGVVTRTYKVVDDKPYVAQVGDTLYESLKEALEACTNGETVQLIADITYEADDIVYAHGGATGFGNYDQYNPSIIYIGGTKGATEAENQPSNVNAVLDLNGHTITSNADAYLFLFMDNCKVTFVDSVGGGKVVNNSTSYPAIWSTGAETLVTIQSGTYQTASATGLIHATHSGDLVIEGGHFSTTADDASLLLMINSQKYNNPNYFLKGVATLTVKGGTFVGFNPEKVGDDYGATSIADIKFVNGCALGYVANDNGDGTYGVEEWDLVIRDIDDLLRFAAMVNAGNTFAGETVLLDADINLAGLNWTPIGNDTNYFCGNFDGQDHIISNMTINVNTPDANQFVGLFGGVKKATIKNLTMTNVNIDVVGAKVRAAAVVGIAHSNSENRTDAAINFENITVNGCKINAEAKSGSALIGGVVGYCYPANLANINVSGLTIDAKADGNNEVRAAAILGYLCGQNISNNGNTRAAMLVDTFNVENVSITADAYTVFAGGYAPYTYYGYITLKDGTIDGLEIDVDAHEAFVGGLVGYFWRSDNGHNVQNVHISNIDFDVTTDYLGETRVGGMVGTSQSPNTKYTDCSVSGKIVERCSDPANPVNYHAKVGGFVARTYEYAQQTYTNCVADVDITATNIAGGFVGNHNSTVSYVNCEARGDVTAATAGGFAGRLTEHSYTTDVTFDGCSASGVVIGTDVAGGFIGSTANHGWAAWTAGNGTAYGKNVTIKDCTASSNVSSGTEYRAGIIGEFKLAEGKTLTLENVSYSVEPPYYPTEVAQIGDVKYWTLADAIAAANAAENGATITLLADATVGEMMTIAKDVIIEGDGKTITWADGYNGTIFNVESGVSVTLKDLTIDGENSFTFYDDTTTVEDGQNWYTRFVDVGEEDKAINDNVIVNAGNLTLDSVRITGVTIASDGDNGKTANTETGGFYLMYNDDLALIKSNGGKVTINGGAIMYNAGMVLNAINAETSLNTNVMYNMGAGNKGGIIIANGGTMDVKGVITYNKAMARSATILGVINGAEVTFDAVMNYNEHIGVGSNTAGAMIVLEGASQFVMNGGTINYNEGGRAGAIASRWVGGNFGQHEDTSIVLNAGSIIGNTASNDSWNGASIFLRSPAAIGEGMTIDGTIAVNAAPGALEITGGTFNNFDMIVTDGLTAEITGGTFDSDPAEWVAEGYVAQKNDDGTYTVRSQTYVEWIKAQLLAGNSVTLDRDVVITDYDLVNALVLPSNGNGKHTEVHGNGAVFHVIKPGVVFDLNGYSLIWDAHHDDYCNKRQVSLFMVTITGNPGETADLTIIDSSAAKTGKVEVYGMGTGLYVVGVDAKGTISGGTWTNYPCKTCGASNVFIYPSHGGELYITDGTFEQKDSEYLIGWKGSSEPTNNNGVGVDYDATKVEITGGTFVGFNPETDVKFFDASNGSAESDVNGCAEGYESIDNGDGTYTVIPTKLALVEVEIMPGFWGTSYITVENWADLVAALGANTNVPVKVTLLENIKLTDEVLTIAGTTKKVIDLNGKRITGTFTEETTAFVYVTGGCELTILDSTVTEVDGFTAGGIHAINTNGNLSNLIRVDDDSKMVIESGNYSQDASVNGAGMIDSRGDEIITIKGGHFRLYNIGSAENGSPWIFNASSQNTKNIIVQGGTFNADIIHQYYPFEVMAPKELALVQGEDGIWYFVPAVAYVNEQEWSSNWYTNEVGYATLEDAIAAVEGIRTKNDKTSAEEFITLLADAVVTGNVDTKGITIEQNGFAIKLAAGATLTAPEGLNVTTDVANRKVVYENGVYKLAVITYAAQIGDTLYETIQDAVYAAQNGDTIIVLVDHEMNCADAVANSSGYAVLVNVANQAVTIDLNGKVITVNVDQNAEIYGIFATDTNGKLTLMDSSADKTGKVEITAPGYLYSVLFAYGADSKLTVNGGRYVADAVADSLSYSQYNEIVEINDGYFYLGNVGTGSNGKPWIFNAKGQNTAHAIVKGGIFNADIIHQFYPFEVSVPKELALVQGVGGIWYFVPAVAYVNEQEWSSNWYTNEVGYATFEQAIAAVEGIRTKNGKTSAEEFITLLGDVMVTGNVDTKGITIVQNGFAIRLGIADATLTAVEGLNVTTDVANRKVVYENGVYKLAVISYAAQIGDTLYETLQDAIDAAKDGDEVVVLENVELGWNDTVNAADGKAVLLHVEGKNIILNLNGKTITVEHMATEEADRIYAVVLVADGAGLTVIGNGTIDVTANETTPRVAYLFWKRGTTGYLVVENGTYHMNHTEDSMIYTNGDEIITIKGGSFTLDSVGTSTNGSPWIFNAQGTGGKSILITGGTFNADINRQHWSDEAVVDKTCYVVNNGDGTWTVMAGAAAHVLEGMLTGPYYAPKEIGYATIEEAIAAAIAKKDNPITLLTDFVLTAPIDAADKTIVQNGFIIKLATADATLTAAEGLNVTTDLAGCKVIYEDGTYKVVSVIYVAEVNGTKYETLADAIKAAENGDVITLLMNVTEDVTVNKSITIDGANFEYTGNIAVKGSAVSATIKNVNFVNGTGYAITTNTIKSITVENCTVENYAYGFLYANKSTPTVVVKNVTVDGGNYGFHWAYGTEATLENFTVSDAKYGLYIQNYGSKTITLKNCDISTIAIWERSGYSGVQTFKFEGQNKVGTLSASQYAKYVLGAADATLTAPEGYTVTTDVAGCKVVYKDGAYKVEKAAVYNETTGKSFDTIAEAMLDARNNGVDNDVIVLQRDLEESVVIIYNGTTLNLKSFTLTADYVVSFNGGKLTGDPNSAAGVGAKLAVPDKQFVALAEDAYFDGSASILPVWDKNQNAFVFSKFIISLTGGFDVTDDNSIFMTQFKVLATGYVNQNILVSNGVGDQASTGIHVEVSASWTKEGDNGDITTQTYRFSDESMALAIIKDANGNTHDYIASITTAGLQNLTMTIRVVSDTGIVLSSQTVSADSLMN